MHSLLTLLLGVTFEGSIALWVVLAGDLLALATVPSVLLRRSGRPLAALSWLLALLALPYAGVLAWWLLGRMHLARHRGRRRSASERLCDRCPPAPSATGMAGTLVARARAGVRVRLLVDAVGSARFLRRRGRALRDAGLEVTAFLPARFRPWAPTFNFRNHRKLLLVDGTVAITGGMNVGETSLISIDHNAIAHGASLPLGSGPNSNTTSGSGMARCSSRSGQSTLESR